MDMYQKNKKEKIRKNKIIVLVILPIIVFLIMVLVLLIRHDKKENMLPDVITSIIIEYYPHYNIETAEALNSLHEYNYIEKQVIKLNKEEIENIKKEINNIYDDTKEFSKCDCLVSDEYKMIINNKYELIIGENWGRYKYLENDIVVNIPDNLYNYVSNKVDENNNKILKTLKANKISFEKDNKLLMLDDELKDNFLDKFSYLEVNIKENYLTYDDGYAYVLYFDDNKVLYLYSSCVIGYLVDNDKNYSSYILVEGIKREDIKKILS